MVSSTLCPAVPILGPRLFVPGGFSARDYGIAVVRSLSVVVCSFVVATMKYLLKFHSDCFEILSADFLWPS